MKLEVTTPKGLVFKWRGNREQAKMLIETADRAIHSYERAEEARLELAKLKAKVKEDAELL